MLVIRADALANRFMPVGIPSIRHLLPNAAATHALGTILGRSLSAGTTLLLEGNLGSGKTTLVQGIGHGLGITDPIVSPSFTLINEYVEGRVPLYHLDLYRLNTSEVAALQPELYWEGVEYPPGIMAIEWAERLPYRPENHLCLRLSVGEASDSDRQIELTVAGALDAEVLADLNTLLSGNEAHQ
uniref:tRNA (adenosine(37)-N6)-threonylcarbamoyltransferase complex ATPase subunit type 1 TsaE n=2 Tax=Oculatella sp. LEGE 06141 TaxID=1828648 RepID=UPI001D1547A1|nr:tRNA (adenosine(37)-N6)-threonylcarbamoyltransferase complex ATPase subunit type 1 TsaE [Oculatella sp. LEGE 06141]